MAAAGAVGGGTNVGGGHERACEKSGTLAALVPIVAGAVGVGVVVLEEELAAEVVLGSSEIIAAVTAT